MNLGTSMLLRALDNSLHAFDVQSANLFLARVVAQENPLFGLDEPPRRQNNPTIVVADSSEIASRDTQCGECTDERRSVVVVDNAAQVLRRLPSRKAAFEQCEQPPCQYEVQKKNVGSVASMGHEALRALDHHTEKRIGKRLNERLPVNRHSVARIPDIGLADNVLNAFVGMVVQLLANRRAGLARFANQRAQAARQHPLCGSIPTYNIEASSNRSVESRCKDRPTTRDLGD